MTVRLLTIQEVAERFGSSPFTVRYWRHSRQRPRRHPGSLRRGRVRPLVANQGHRCWPV